jgi:uncharacterized membrane protein YvbJ
MMKCPKCQHENPDAQKFCGECGYNLTSSSTPSPQAHSIAEKIDKFNVTFPRGLPKRSCHRKIR